MRVMKKGGVKAPSCDRPSPSRAQLVSGGSEGVMTPSFLKRHLLVWLVGTMCLSVVLIAAAPTSGPTSRALSRPASQPAATLPKETPLPPRQINQIPALGLLYTGGLRSYFEPCGCQADQLGGFGRLGALLRGYRAAGLALLPADAGNLFYEKLRIKPATKMQSKLKAEMIADQMKIMSYQVMGVGPHDLTFGVDTFKGLSKRAGLRVVASNLVDHKSGKALWPTRLLLTYKGRKFGFLSLTGVPPKPPTLPVKAADAHGPEGFPADFWSKRGLRVLAPLPVAKREVAALRKAGAEVVVLLSTLGIVKTTKLLGQLKGVDLAVDGHDEEELEPPKSVAGAMLLSTPKEGQKAGLFAMYWRKGQRGWSAIITAKKLRKDIKSKREQVASYYKQAKEMLSQGAAFKPIAGVYVKQARALKREIILLQKRLTLPLRLPNKGQGYVHALVDLAKALGDDTIVAARIALYQKEVKEANLKALKQIKPVLTNKQGNSYIGVETCKTCHNSQYQFWKKTQHAHAYATLAKKNKQFDLDCIGCHVVGWQKPGGLYDIQKPQRLANVQCENCHSHGAIHATKKPMKSTIRGKVPASVCKGCHQGSHHPNFNYLTNVKKILGKGHGEKRLAELLKKEKEK